MNVFFLFPGRVWLVYYLSQGSEQTKNPTGQKCFVCFGTLRRDTRFWFLLSILFLNSLSGGNPRRQSPNDRTRSCKARDVSDSGLPGALLFALRSPFR